MADHWRRFDPGSPPSAGLADYINPLPIFQVLRPGCRWPEMPNLHCIAPAAVINVDRAGHDEPVSHAVAYTLEAIVGKRPSSHYASTKDGGSAWPSSISTE